MDTCQLDILVENLGRANFGVPHTFNQKKGIWEGDILIDGQGQYFLQCFRTYNETLFLRPNQQLLFGTPYMYLIFL